MNEIPTNYASYGYAQWYARTMWEESENRIGPFLTAVCPRCKKSMIISEGANYCTCEDNDLTPEALLKAHGLYEDMPEYIRQSFIPTTNTGDNVGEGGHKLE